MVVPPKWMIYNGKPYLNGWFGGTTILKKPPYGCPITGRIPRFRSGPQFHAGRLEIDAPKVCKALVDVDPLLHNVSNIQGYADTLQDIVERFKDAWNVNTWFQSLFQILRNM